MKKRNGQYNPKRKLLKREDCNFARLRDLSERVRYGGNPEHKKNPGDFRLTPPSGPRTGKSLCDTVQVFTRRKALELLQIGLRNGLVSDRHEGEWPKNIWPVINDETPLEAQHESGEPGTYHGYPLQEDDPFWDEVLERWRQCSDPL